MTPHPYCRCHEGEACRCDSEYRRPAVQKPCHERETPEAYARRLERRRAKRTEERAS